MTAPDPTLDELASAYLDGTATPAEAARVEADPVIQARVEEMRQARGELRSAPTEVDPVVRDRQIARALAEIGAPGSRPGNVLQLERTRPRPRPLLVGAAAAVVALGMLAAAVGLLQRESGDDTAAIATGEPRTLAEADVADEPAEPERAVLPHLGDFDDLGALSAVLTTQGLATQEADPPPEALGEPHPVLAGPAGPTDADDVCALPAEPLATARLAERLVTVHRVGDRLSVFDPVSCELLTVVEDPGS